MNRWLAACQMTVLAVCWLVALVSCNSGGSDSNGSSDSDNSLTKDMEIVIDKCNGYTPIKNQGRNSNCWMYGMLAAIETEHISRGDSIHLSVRYGMRKLIEDATAVRYMSNGHNGRSTRGMAQDALSIIERHGAMPYDAYSGGDCDIAYSPSLRTAYRLADKGVRLKMGLGKVMADVNRSLDSALGPCPPRVFMLGAEYSKGEFGRSVCAPEEYVALTSCTHHPFFEMMTIESGDNYEHHQQLNVPLDLLRSIILYAVENGHGVCWQGDISEPGFSFKMGIARLGKGHTLSQERRQKELESMETTDDHCMAIIGRAHDTKGTRYLIMKNSWGIDNPYKGLMMVSEDYALMKSMVVIVPVSCARTCISSYRACPHHSEG